MVTEDGRGVCRPIVGCNARLSSLEVFEDHYSARHTASCSVFSRVYPTSCLLSIYACETHDSFFQEVACCYAVYECLVEGCGLNFKSYKSRQQHLVDKHNFPTSFEFFKKALPSRKRRQKHHRKLALHTKEGSITMEIEDETINGLVSAVFKLSTSDSTPSSVSFGCRHTSGLTFIPRAAMLERTSDFISAGTKR